MHDTSAATATCIVVFVIRRMSQTSAATAANKQHFNATVERHLKSSVFREHMHTVRANTLREASFRPNSLLVRSLATIAKNDSSAATRLTAATTAAKPRDSIQICGTAAAKPTKEAIRHISVVTGASACIIPPSS
jgi:hypothetical protein